MPEPIPQHLHPEIDALLRSGRKIEAIKRVREQTGMGLAESKDAVEALELSRVEVGGGSPVQMRRSGCLPVLLLLAALPAVAWMLR